MRLFAWILFALPFLLRAQSGENFLIENINNLSYQSPGWFSVERKISTGEKNALIKLVLRIDSSEYCYSEYMKSPEDFLNFYKGMFHFVDIDNDSKTDVIFLGKHCSGIEGGAVNIYHTKKDALRKIYSSRGKMVSFKTNGSFIVHEYPCCAMTLNVLKTCEIKKDSVYELCSITFHKSFLQMPIAKTIIPQKIKFVSEVEVKQNAEVRFGAQNKVFDNPLGIDSIIIARTKTNIKCQVFSHSIDKSGQKWLFVKLNYQDIIQRENLPKTTIVGWIKNPD